MFDREKIKELYPEAENLMIQPMLIHSSTDAQLKRACESNKYFGQIKKDGALYMFVRTEHHNYLFGRTISKKTGLLTEKGQNIPHIIDVLNRLPRDTVLLGEIYYPGKTSKDVVSIMGCLPQKAVQRQQGTYGFIHYYIYDILVYNGENYIDKKISNIERYKKLKEVFTNFHFSDVDFLELAEIWEDNLYSRVGDALNRGEEGMVIKQKDSLYEPGKRPMTNLKAKKVDFIDVVITGFQSPTKEYYGKEINDWQYWINPQTNERYPIGLYKQDNEHMAVTKSYYMNWFHSKICIGAYDENNKLKDIGIISSGITDEMKMDMTENPDNYNHKVCSVQCMEKDNKAYTLRHGFFKGMRLDKNSKDCILNLIFDK